MITFSDIQKQYGSRVIFNHVSFSINPVQRIGLIGRNGAGKTLLLRLLNGEEHVDGGTISIPPALTIGYLPQEMDIDTSLTPLELVLTPFMHLFEIDAVMEKMAACTDHDSAEYHKAARAYTELHTARDLVQVDSLEGQAKSILAGLGVPEGAWGRSIQELSGGYHMRVQLAQLLLRKPDFLLLDEPTNHLDMDSLIWLEKFLQRNKNGMLIVSHDRDFLDRLTTHTLEIASGSVTQYTGTVASFFSWKEMNSTTENRRAKNIQDQIAQTEQFINRFKSKNTKASQARSKMKQLERLKEQLPEQHQFEKTIRFRLPDPVRSGAVPLLLEKISVSYGTSMVFRDLSLSVSRGDKIAIIGPNGAGKSTLLKTIVGVVTPSTGTVTIGHNVHINYYSQHRLEQLNPEKTLYETVAEVCLTSDKTRIQSILGEFLFSGDEVLKKVGVLSGGEKSRLSLATILANPGNVLLLDEPTNHLDIESVERLAMVLNDFLGTMLIVSHDEYFLSCITNRIIELRQGSYRDFPGRLSDYRSYIEEGYIDQIPRTNTINNPDNDDKQERIRIRQERKKTERTIAKLEQSITALEEEMAFLKTELHNPMHASDVTKLMDLNASLEEKQIVYNSLFSEWEQLQEQLTGSEDGQ